MESKTEGTTWKSIKNYIRNWCQKWCCILFGAIYRENKQCTNNHGILSLEYFGVKVFHAITYKTIRPFYAESKGCRTILLTSISWGLLDYDMVNFSALCNFQKTSWRQRNYRQMRIFPDLLPKKGFFLFSLIEWRTNGNDSVRGLFFPMHSAALLYGTTLHSVLN